MPKIMVVDDEESVCLLLRKLFEGEGYKVITETDPIKAIELVKVDRPDCMLLDIKMPRKEGVEVLACVKEFDKSIEVIMITGYSSIENAMESMKLGAFDYITKPFDLNFVKDLVKRSLSSENKRGAM